jgi:hypothetical protein
MPIKSENKSRYPANWLDIRAAILERAGNCCEQCKVANRTRICRGTGVDIDTYMTDEAEVFCANTGELFGQKRMSDYCVGHMVDIVLTVSHTDHVIENCDPSNRRALCQRCHLRHDAPLHAANARITRRARRAVGDLFSEVQS